MLFLSMDACFRVKRYKISSTEKDPILENGWAFFVEETAYKEQVKKYKGQKEARTYRTSSDCALTSYRADLHMHRVGGARSRRHQVFRRI